MLAAVRRFVDDALSDGATPVLLGYALGKAQEILKFLSDAGYPCAVHPVVARGEPRLRGARGRAPERARARAGGGRVRARWSWLRRTSSRGPAMRASAGAARAVLTGWAIDGRRWFRGADAAFPLSDHADFPSLVRYAKATGAGRVFTVHGYAAELAAALRTEGSARSRSPRTKQLELL